MDTNLLTIIIFAFLGVIIVGLIFYIIHQMEMIKLEKRFASFSLLAKNDDETSFFDRVSNSMGSLIQKLTIFLKKSVFAKNYAKKYERFISYEERETKEPLEYIAIKILSASSFTLLALITFAIQKKLTNPMPILLAFLIGFFLPDLILNLKFRQKRKQIEEDLLRAIIIMNNNFKAGRNIMQAICVVKKELDGPIADEFKKIYLDMTYGLSLEVVFNRFYERVKLNDAKYIASALTLLSKTGGNIVKVFNSIEKNFYAKKRLEQELKSLTSASVFVYRVLIVLPLVFTLIIYILNPSYFTPLFKHPLGLVLIALILALFILYVMIIKKVLKVEME